MDDTAARGTTGARRLDEVATALGSSTHSPGHPWPFRARFRRNAFGWKSQPAVSRVREAVWEVKKVAKKGPLVAAEGAVSSAELAAMFDALAERRKAMFAADYRAVGDWSFESDGAEAPSLRCEVVLPQGCEARVPPRAEIRISIDGRFLDEVQIRQTATYRLSFPPERHRADASDACVTIDTPACVAVQLFADGTLPPVRRAAVEIVVHAQPPRRMVLVEVLTGSRSVAGEVVTLTFQPDAGTA